MSPKQSSEVQTEPRKVVPQGNTPTVQNLDAPPAPVEPAGFDIDDDVRTDRRAAYLKSLEARDPEAGRWVYLYEHPGITEQEAAMKHLVIVKRTDGTPERFQDDVIVKQLRERYEARFRNSSVRSKQLVKTVYEKRMKHFSVKRNFKRPEVDTDELDAE